MSDIFSSEKRSAVMKAVKSRNTKTTELKMIEIFKELHIIGWRRTYPLIGKPDFVFPKKRIVIFVDGCFWHGHDCRNVTPSDNAEFWEAKRLYNKKHDEEVTQTLLQKNWTVIRIWECELKNKNRELLLEKISMLLRG
jgi:DNA mismatch endonuclease (patch repair protein)